MGKIPLAFLVAIVTACAQCVAACAVSYCGSPDRIAGNTIPVAANCHHRGGPPASDSPAQPDGTNPVPCHHQSFVSEAAPLPLTALTTAAPGAVEFAHPLHWFVGVARSAQDHLARGSSREWLPPPLLLPVSVPILRI